MKQIKKISYFENNSFGDSIQYLLDVPNRKEEFVELLGMNVVEKSRDLEKEIILEKCDRIGNIVSNWQDVYYNTGILDGFETKIQIQFEDYSEKSIYCNNKLPNNFNELKTIIEELK